MQIVTIPGAITHSLYWRVHTTAAARWWMMSIVCRCGRSAAGHIIRWAEAAAAEAGLIETLLQRFMHSLAHKYKSCECAFLRLSGWQPGQSDGDCGWPISSSSLIFDAN